MCLHIYTAIKLLICVVQELCHLLGIHSTKSSAYHQVERLNETVESMLAKVNDEDHQNSDLYLPKALFAYRTSLHNVTGFTPFHLTFRHSPQLPIDAMLGRIDKAKVQSYPQFIQQTHGYLTKAYILKATVSQYHLQQQHSHDKGGTVAELHIGDVVWLYTPVIK